MTGIEWLIAACLAALALWVVAGVIDARDTQRPVPPVTQPAKAAPPLLPQPERLYVNLARVRAVRAARARGRHRSGGAL